MDGQLDLFEQLEADRRAKKIAKRDTRGYSQKSWRSISGQRFRCHACKKTFSRMEVLLQHFRDSKWHSEDPLAQQASKQLADWLKAKDEHKHCCPTCCLGFDTETELLVHFKNTAVHQNTPQAEQAASLLLPKDEARFLRRDLHSAATPATQPPVSPSLQQPSSLKRRIAWQTVSAVDEEAVSSGQTVKARKFQVARPKAAAADAGTHEQQITATAATGSACPAESGRHSMGELTKDMQCSPDKSSSPHAHVMRSTGNANGSSANEMNQGLDASQRSANGISNAPPSAPSPDSSGISRLLGQSAFVHSLRRRTVFRKPRRRGITNKQVAEESNLKGTGYDATRMSIIETRLEDKLDLPPPPTTAIQS